MGERSSAWTAKVGARTQETKDYDSRASVRVRAAGIRRVPCGNLSRARYVLDCGVLRHPGNPRLPGLPRREEVFRELGVPPGAGPTQSAFHRGLVPGRRLGAAGVHRLGCWALQPLEQPGSRPAGYVGPAPARSDGRGMEVGQARRSPPQRSHSSTGAFPPSRAIHPSGSPASFPSLLKCRAPLRGRPALREHEQGSRGRLSR